LYRFFSYKVFFAQVETSSKSYYFRCSEGNNAAKTAASVCLAVQKTPRSGFTKSGHCSFDGSIVKNRANVFPKGRPDTALSLMSPKRVDALTNRLALKPEGSTGT